MAQILDSGARRDFGTGAVRDAADGKGRCDLLPLEIIGQINKNNVLMHIGRYIYGGDPDDLRIAFCEFIIDHFPNFYDAMLELSGHFEEGAKKYAERNWESGMPLHCFIDSGVRHYLKFMRGDKDEPHDRAFLWNIICAMWTQENRPEMIDLPFAIQD